VDADYEKPVMIDIFDRLYQREYYYHIYHNMPKGMSEVKGIAVLCHLLLKYRPLSYNFRAKNESERNDREQKRKYEMAHAYFVERFCLHQLNCLSRLILKKNISQSLRNRVELEYCLRHGNLSSEALTIIFENLVDLDSMPA
jgi:hypothetical protein